MEAPLGRAVIGGLVMSTFATLLVLPSIFALVIGGKQPGSPSLYPGNPESQYHDPDFDPDEIPSEGDEGNGAHANGDGRHRDGQAEKEALAGAT
jgi:hypothetical protein